MDNVEQLYQQANVRSDLSRRSPNGHTYYLRQFMIVYPMVVIDSTTTVVISIFEILWYFNHAEHMCGTLSCFTSFNICLLQTVTILEPFAHIFWR